MNVTLRRLLVGTMAFPLIDIRRYCMCKFEVSTSWKLLRDYKGCGWL